MKNSNRPEKAAASDDRTRQVAEAVRQACLEVARTRFETASMDGLCASGALEVALDGLRSLDLETIIHRIEEKE